MDVTPAAVVITVAVVAAVCWLLLRLARRGEAPSPEAARAAAPASSTRGVWEPREGDPLVPWLLDHASEQTGVSVANDPLARQRVEEAAAKARSDLDAGGTATVSLPFLAADQRGPKHFQARIRRMPDGTYALAD